MVISDFLYYLKSLGQQGIPIIIIVWLKMMTVVLMKGENMVVVLR